MPLPFIRRRSSRGTIAPRAPRRIRLKLEHFEERTLLSAVNWTGGSGDWNTPSNWSSGMVPGAADDVTIATPGVTITHTTTAYDQIKTLTLADDAGITFELGNGTLGVVNAEFNDNTVRLKGKSTFMIHSSADSTGQFEMIEFDSTISGAGMLTTHGSALWTAGILDADWMIAENSTINISGEKNKLIRGTFNNAGTVIWTGTGRIGVSSLTVINNLETGLWECQNDTPFFFRNDDGWASHPFNNFGTFRKQGGTLQTAFDGWGELINHGRVEVMTGTLVVAGGGANDGTFEVAAGANLQFIGVDLNYDLDEGTVFEGAGKVTVNSNGTLSVNAPIAIDNPFETNTGGTLRGNGPLIVTNTFAWLGGQVTGNMDVAPDATINITGTQFIILKGTLNNYGTVNWTGAGHLNVTSRSVLVNHAGAVFDIQNDQFIEFHEDDGYAPWLFQNDGMLRKSVGTDTSTFENSYLVNNGALEVHTGTVHFLGDYFPSLVAGKLVNGSYLVKGTLKIDGAAIGTNGVTLVLDGAAGKVVDGADANALAQLSQNTGFLHLVNGATLTTTGPLENKGGLLVAAGSQLNIGGNLTQTAGVTTLEEGALDANAVNIQAGQLYGYGTITANLVNAGVVHVGVNGVTGILTIDGNYTQTSAGTLLVHIAGLTVGAEYDQLQVTGTATLAGRLGVFMASGYTPDPGDTFRVVLAESATGTFTSFRGAATVFDVEYDPNGVVLNWPAAAPRSLARHFSAPVTRRLARLR